jgi:hypothetical protein
MTSIVVATTLAGWLMVMVGVAKQQLSFRPPEPRPWRLLHPFRRQFQKRRLR